jgi:hypothetical protein
MLHTKRTAAGLLTWLIDFLPGTIPSSPEDAILDVPDDVHALFWHRSELQSILQKHPEALTETQKKKLVKLDGDIRVAALLLLGAGKGMLRRYREGRYDRSHWWWYLDDMLQEEAVIKSQTSIEGGYQIPVEGGSLQKVAERQATYRRKSKAGKHVKK